MQYATRLIPAGLILIAAIAAPRRAHGAEPPADLCSLLQPQDVSKVLGKSFNPPQKSVAPRPFVNTVEGTDCHYGSKDRSDLMFRIYVDPSPGDSKSLHDRLSAFYQLATPIPGLGDQASA